MNVLDLFSGIGGFSLGLERAGMRTVAFCECDPYCQRVLRKHWPDVLVFGDVKTLTAADMADAAKSGLQGTAWKELSGQRRASVKPSCGIDVIAGGFPCQDLSVAGKGAGITGERSGLWSEFARIIGEVRPRYVIIENVANLLSGRSVVDGPDGPRVISWMGRILGDLAALGLDAEWHCIPASAVGAPHRRDRVWIVAHAGCKQRRAVRSEPEQDKSTSHFHDQRCGADVAQPDSPRREQQCWRESISAQLLAAECSSWWLVEPDVGRVAHGIPARVHRLRALGNAIVPQIAEIIGRAIMQCEASRNG